MYRSTQIMDAGDEPSDATTIVSRYCKYNVDVQPETHKVLENLLLTC